MPTNVPAPVLSDNGFAVPEDLDVLAGVLADFQAAFQGALNPALATPQGQLASSIAAILASVNDLFLLLTNNVDPAFASGRMQDAIARIYFLTRLPPLPTSVTAVATGAPGTVIPAGSLAQATDGQIYQSVDDETIGQGGTVSIGFQSLNTGPIACPLGTLTRIYRAIPGWDAITNPAAGTPGRDVETRAAFEQRRAASVALNATGTLPAMRATVLSVDNVLDAFVTENPTDSATVIGGVTLAAHSLYVAAVGGTDADVARAIWKKKNPGCSYNGNTTVAITDNSGLYGSPQPSYNVTFQRPTAVRTYFNVQLASTTAVPANAQTLIRAALVAAFNGQDGGPRAQIGSTLYASRFYSTIAALGPWVQIVNLTLGTSSPGSAASVSFQIDQVPSLTGTDVTVSLV